MIDFSALPTAEVNTTTSGSQYTPVVGALANGGYVVAWESAAGSSPGVYAQRYDAQGQKVGGEIAVFYDPGSTLPGWTGYHVGGIAGLADGTFVVTAYSSWVDPSGGDASALYAQRLDASGHAVGSPVLVQSGDNANWAQGGPVFATPGGGYAVVEQRIEHPLPYSNVAEVVHPFNSGNSPAGASFAFGDFARASYDVAETGSGNFVMAALGTGAGPTVLTWEVANAAGTVLSSAQLAGTSGSSQYAEPAVVALADGTSLVAWQLSQYDANGNVASSSWQAQRIGADGQPSGAAFTLPLDASASTAVKFTALAGGGFVATWPQAAGTDGTAELVAEYFDAAANASGKLIHVAAIPDGDFYYHLPYGVTTTSDGGFVVTAEWNTGDATGLDIYQQKFNPAPAGTPGPYIDVSGASGITTIPAGNFTIGGDGGHEQVAFASSHSSWTVTPTTQGMSLTGPEGTDLLVDVERVRFGDGYAVAFDVSGDAGQAYRLYQAAFDRAPDLGGLGFHIHDLDAGVSLSAVAQHFVDSPEFQSKYGSLDNTAFITLLYQNVLHRAPEQAGLQFHLNEFAQGQSRADMLTHFSESPENQANVIGQIADGMWFIPLA